MKLTRRRLIKFTVEGIRTKLDRIYLESLETSAQSASASRVSPSEVSALQEELESLYAEILPVAQMAAEQQFLEPALKSRVARNGQVLARSAQATNYVSTNSEYFLPIPTKSPDPRLPRLPYRPRPGPLGPPTSLPGLPTRRQRRHRDRHHRTRHPSLHRRGIPHPPPQPPAT